MEAIALALASACFFASGLVLTQFGLRTVHPLSGSAISIPSYTAAFLLVSPFVLHDTAIDWRMVPFFAAIGLVYPALLTQLTFASSHALGAVITGALGNLSPIFSVALAVLILEESIRPMQVAGLAVAILGALTVTWGPANLRNWRLITLLLPLGASFMRGVAPPIIKLGLESWPAPLAAGLVGYIFSSITVLTIEKVRTGRFIVQAPLSGRLWFALNGIANGLATTLIYAAVSAGPVVIVVPVIATYPLITIVLTAVFLRHVRITPKLIVGTVLAVAGVVLIVTA